MKKFLREFGCMILISLVVFFLLGGGYVIKTYFEMKAFNKFSQTTKASFVDAFFSELRIEACK